MTELHATQGSPVEAPEHLVKLLHGFDTAMLITRRRSGALRGRPMAISDVERDGTLWFLTSVSSDKVQELTDDSRAMVSLQKSSRFVTLNGNVQFVHDRAKIHKLWKVTDGAWFQSKDDPDIVLLRFSPFDAEYWDTAGTRGLRYVFELVKSVVEGAPMGGDAVVPETHGKLVDGG